MAVGANLLELIGINVSHGNNGTARSNFPAHKFLIGFSTQNSAANGRIENRLGHYARLRSAGNPQDYEPRIRQPPRGVAIGLLARI